MSSVTFPTNLGGNGQTYTDDNNPSTGLRDGGWRSRFVPCLEQTVAIANTLTNRVIFGSDVSSTSIAVSTGSKTLTTSGSFTWAAGMFVTIARTSATANYLFGQVVSYNASTDQLVVNVTSVAGSGTYTDWTIAIAPPGLAPASFTGPATITVGSASDALRITQTGAGNALVVEDSANPDSTPFVIDTVGNVVLGSSAQRFSANLLEINNAGNSNSGLGVIQWFTTNASGPAINIMKSQSGTPGTNGIVSNGAFSNIFFRFDDGANFLQAAAITAAVDGTPGTNDMPGRIIFSTTADGASSPTERMRIDNAGRVGIGGTPFTDTIFGIYRHSTGGTTVHSFRTLQTVQPDVTATAAMFQTVPSTAAASFNLNFLKHYVANQGTIGLGSTVSNQFGFIVEASLTGATNNYGFYSNIASGTGRYNFYAAGTAANYFAGNVGIGGDPLVPTLETFSNSNNWVRLNATGIPLFAAYKSNGTIAAKTIVVSGDEVGRFDMRAYDGANFIPLAQISGYVDGTPGLNDMPGRLVFSTTADGASSPTERMRIDKAGNIYGTSGTTTMTNGFFYIPSAAGAPSGVPTAVSGRVPMYYDTTNNNFYVYNGAWKKVLLA